MFFPSSFIFLSFLGGCEQLCFFIGDPTARVQCGCSHGVLSEDGISCKGKVNVLYLLSWLLNGELFLLSNRIRGTEGNSKFWTIYFQKVRVMKLYITGVLLKTSHLLTLFCVPGYKKFVAFSKRTDIWTIDVDNPHSINDPLPPIEVKLQSRLEKWPR